MAKSTIAFNTLLTALKKGGAEIPIALSSLLTPTKCWQRVQCDIERLSELTPALRNSIDEDNILKRIFIFAEIDEDVNMSQVSNDTVPTSRMIPQVCRKWRDLHAEFREEQKQPEMRLTSKKSEKDNQRQNESHSQEDIEFSFLNRCNRYIFLTTQASLYNLGCKKTTS